MKQFFKKYIALVLFFLVLQLSKAQDTAKYFSIKDAIQYGIENQPTVLKSDLELKKYNYQYKEKLASYLPQISADASYTYNLKLLSQIIPGDFIGQPGEDVAVQFGTKYNAAANINVSQTLLDLSQVTSQKIAKESMKIGLLNKQKTIEQTIYDIANAYTVCQVTLLQQDIIQNNIQKVDSLIIRIKSQVDNGFAKPIDLKRLELNHSDLSTQLQNAKIEYEQSITVLKYTMAYPLDIELRINTKIDEAETDVLGTENSKQSSIDAQLLATQKHLTELSIKQLRQSYLPTLSLNFRYGTLAQQNEANIFKAGTNWFPNSLISANLSIPIFDGNYKSAKSSQLKIDQQQNELDSRILENTIDMQMENVQSKLANSIANLSSLQKNIELAEEIYAMTQVQFQSGFTSLTELLDADTALKQAQTNYLIAIAQVQLAELELLKVSGNIQSILN